jgi:S-adenosylmethionine:tRNA ribosyltransferase-isomerase
VDVEDLSKHKMDSEQVIIEDKAVQIVNKAKENKKKVCAVGTTSSRAIETSVTISGMLKPFNGWTNKFLFPPYDFSVANSMITNFHLPQSTLLMHIAAFAGFDFLMKAYKEAVSEKYKFFTYGDAMLII